MGQKGRRVDYLELLVAVAVVAIGVATARYLSLQVAVTEERQAMEAVVMNLENALARVTADYLQDGNAAGLLRWDRANPMELLTIKPDNYAGRFSDRDNKPPKGNWYYDKNERQLVYSVVHRNHFQGLVEGRHVLARYQLRFLYNDHNGNGRFEAATEEAIGLRLQPEQDYRWRN